ncbi:MAG: type 1 glutamine amidotransferase [Bacteroidia bacterium]
MQKIKVAILDMYLDAPNQGMRNIHEILNRFALQHKIEFEKTVIDIRGKQEKPTLDYDVYISSGGPGSPIETEGWEQNYVQFVKDLMAHNIASQQKKHAFFICHSFQVMCHHFNLAKVCLRKSESFGTFPVFPTEEGLNDVVFKNLPRPFYIVDSRKWQVIEPNDENLDAMGAQILALEKIRKHVDLERATMAIRFSPEMIGTQFHPEADAEGMIFYLKGEEKKKLVIDTYGEEKFIDMLYHLNDPDKIMFTQNTMIPQFLTNALQLQNHNQASL